MDIDKKALGERIRGRRVGLHIKQKELSACLGISNNHLSSIENGAENPSLEAFVKICGRLKVTPDYLLLGAMHSNNVPINIYESLRLLDEEDIGLIEKIVDYLIERKNRQTQDFVYGRV